MTQRGKTGLFYRAVAGQTEKQVVLLQDGKEIACYNSTTEFVETHVDGLNAIEQRNDGLLQAIAEQYQKPS